MTKPQHALFTQCRKMKTLLPSFQGACEKVFRASIQSHTNHCHIRRLCTWPCVYAFGNILYITLTLDFLMLFPWVITQWFLDFKSGGIHHISLTWRNCCMCVQRNEWTSCHIMVWISICSWMLWSLILGCFLLQC